MTTETRDAQKAPDKPHEAEEQELREQAEEQSVEEAARLTSKLVYEVIRRDGEEELVRTNRSLVWAGISAGILISFSVIAEAVLRTYLPKAPWAYLVENLGYSVGFLLVILGRMQLFTENTITSILPFLAHPSRALGLGVLRLWGIVLTANVAGAFLAAWFMAYTGGIPDNVLPALDELATHATEMGAWTSFIRGVPAGLLVAAIVWTTPEAEGNEVLVITLFTWMIAVGDFSHVVAGSVEMAYQMLRGVLSPTAGILEFFLPTLAGNIIGGTVIFALMAWGQVRDEYTPRPQSEWRRRALTGRKPRRKR